MKKIAIFGLADTACDPRALGMTWRPWGLAWDSRRYEFERTFEMHELADCERGQPSGYLDNLKDLAKFAELYMLRGGSVEGSKHYPLQRVIANIGIDYFASSIAYMLALAISEEPEEIALYGVDCDLGSEYEYQKANMEYLIGLARGRGIIVHLPPECPLCRYINPPGFEFVGGYGRRA